MDCGETGCENGTQDFGQLYDFVESVVGPPGLFRSWTLQIFLPTATVAGSVL